METIMKFVIEDITDMEQDLIKDLASCLLQNVKKEEKVIWSIHCLYQQYNIIFTKVFNLACRKLLQHLLYLQRG
jgi:hypothetical protein